MQRNTLALWLSLLMMTMPLVGFTYDNDTLGTSIDSSSDARAVDGCTNPSAVNYDPEATNDDGSCKYEPILFSPNGGEEWDVGSTEEITWNATGWSIVSLSYSNDAGTTWIHIATVDNGGSHEWMVPDTPNSKALVRITVFGQDADGNNQTWNDGNDRYFTIKANPTSNQCAKLIIEANGFVSPAWEDPLASASGTPYTLDDIVEWPAGSGQWWMSGYYNNVDEPGVGSEWTSGPCTCEDIWNYTQTVWDSSTVYQTFEVVEHNGDLYYALCVNCTNIGFEPSIDSPYWVLCHNGTGKDCRTGYNGYGGPLWTPGTAVTAGEIYEYPANSGEFYIAHTASTQNVMAPDSITPDASEIWTDYCNCSEIWMGTGLQSVWDLADTYNPWYIVEWQAGSGELWIANQFIFAGQDEPDVSTNWTRCGGGGSPGGPCSEFNGFGGPAWVSGSVANIGDIFEHPAGSGEFYMLVSGGGGVMPDPGPGDEWSEACNCSEIWQGNNQPMWDSALATNNPSNPYDAWYIVGYGQPPTLYISEMNDNTMLPDATRWHHCGPTTCADVSGPWPHWFNPQWSGVGYSVGDQVSFGNGLYISTMNNNMVWPNVPDKRAWIECNCSDLDSTSWDIQSTYGAGDVVVDSDGDYWIALLPHSGVPPTPFVTHDLNGNEALFWRPCDYCDLSDSHIDGLWNQNIAGIGGYAYGDIREHGGSYYIAIIDGTQQEPGTDTWWFYWQWGTNTIKLQL
ncbi:MAG TPA: hypothetical protein EYQ80_02015, partial [Candidatus Poseidoniales archaeon]|nr:hypothetical protein [Candidatus Poseidoniales archaeon]